MYIFILFFKIVIVKIVNSQPNLKNFMLGMETQLKSIANITETLYLQRCNLNCESSFYSCSTTLPKFNCESRFNNKKCNCSDIKGRNVSLSNTTVFFQKMNDPFPNENEVEVQELVCGFRNISKEFLKIHQNNNYTKSQYIGTYKGVHLIYPGRDRCNEDYDNRYRPWYVSASMGSKNLILIIDTSTSMSNSNKIEVAKQAAISVLKTLNLNDWIGIVIFNTEAYSKESSMVRATKENINKMMDRINNITLRVGTNYEAAFNEVYNLIKRTKADEYGELCSEYILILLTDGQESNEITNKNNLIDLMNILYKEVNPILFSFSIGEGSEPNFLNDLSCRLRGLTQKVTKSSKLNNAMLNYFLLLSYGAERKDPIWIEPYKDIDENGGDNITTIAIPIYDRSVNPPFLLGVIGVDFNLDMFNQNEISKKIFYQNVIESNKCTKISLNECQLESLRGNYKCNRTLDTSCEPIRTSASLCPNKIPLNDLFVPNTKIITSEEMPFIQCCSEKNKCQNNITYVSIDNHSENNTGLIIGLIVAGIIIVSLIITFVIFKIKYSKNTEPKSDPDPKHKLDIKLDTVSKPKDFPEINLDPKPYPYLSKDTEEHVYSNMPKELKTDNIND